MYQQTNDNQKFSSVVDIILVIAVLAIIVFIKSITNFFTTSLPAPFNAICNIALLFLIVGFCLFVYKRRLCSYRYAIYYQEPEVREEDAFGDPVSWPYPLGAVTFERMTGGRGKLCEGMDPKDFVALLEPGEKYEVNGEKISFFNYARLTVYSARTAHTLVFRRKGKLYGIYFHPNEDFIAHMKESPLYAAKEA